MGKVANKINGKRKTELGTPPPVEAPLPENRCAQCANWDPEGRPPDMGLCRGGLPQLIMENGVMRAFWPVINKTEWCGQFKAKGSEQ